MIKRIWTFKRIILAIIIFICTIIVAISLQKSIMGTDKLQRDFGVALLFIVVLVCLLYFLYKLLIPKSFRCMTVVKKYLSFRELKDRINNESFSKVVIDEKKSGKIEIYYSSKWIYADEVYIPRKLVLDLIAERKSLYSSFEKLSIATKNGENIVFAIIDIEEAEKIIKSLQGIFEEFTLDFNNMRKIQNRILRKEIKQEFYKRVINKEDFLKESGL